MKFYKTLLLFEIISQNQKIKNLNFEIFSSLCTMYEITKNPWQVCIKNRKIQHYAQSF